MSREIKFRCWDVRQKEMLDADKLKITICNGKLEYIWYQKDANCSFGSTGTYLDQSRYILMQATGLKDKVGVEIYEGDVLEWAKFGDEVDFYRDSIAFCDGAFITVDEDEVLAFSDYENCKVIGNIYQHPELLKEERA